MGTASLIAAATTADEERTVCQAFEELLADLQIEQYKATASKQQRRLRERMEEILSVAASYLTGSYRRNTQIFPLNDIDVLLVLDRDEYESLWNDPYNGVVEMLDLVERALRAAYPNSEIERFDRCIRLQLAASGIGFDVIPAFQDGDDVFYIPDERLRRFIPTNPKEHERLITAANQERCEGMLVPLAKLCKAVNEHMGKPLTGFHVEMMTYYALQTAPDTYRQGVATLLSDFASRVWFAVPDPWPYGLRADEYLSYEKRAEAAASFAKLAEHANAALQAESDGLTDEAHRRWGEVFGNSYPVIPHPPAKVARLTSRDAARAITSSSRISATSAGLVAVVPGLVSARTSTSHGGRAPHRSQSWSGVPANETWHERQINNVLRQFRSLKRLTPEQAAADPALWPATERDATDLYAVLVGDQHTNLGVRHRLLVLIPKDAPAVEAAIYDLHEHRKRRITRHGWRPVRSLVHHWGGRVMCTHAARDRWDGQLTTLLIWAVDWLFRQDYRQVHGRWIGPQIDAKGRLVVNGVVQYRDHRLTKAGREGRRVPL